MGGIEGMVLLQAEGRGEAWYVFPGTGERYYLGEPEEAFEIMKSLGLGISDADLARIPLAEESAGRLLKMEAQKRSEAKALPGKGSVSKATGNKRVQEDISSGEDLKKEIAGQNVDDMPVSDFRMSAKYDPSAGPRYGNLAMAIVSVIGMASLAAMLLKNGI